MPPSVYQLCRTGLTRYRDNAQFWQRLLWQESQRRWRQGDNMDAHLL